MGQNPRDTWSFGNNILAGHIHDLMSISKILDVAPTFSQNPLILPGLKRSVIKCFAHCDKFQSKGVSMDRVSDDSTNVSIKGNTTKLE